MYPYLVLTIGTFANALTVSPPADFDGTHYTIPSATGGTNHFTTFQNYTFLTAGDWTALPAGLSASNNSVLDQVENTSATYNHTFQPENVAVGPPYVKLTVPGGQAGNTGSISSAEFSTDDNSIVYASVRTIAIWSTEPGTINGLFFYRDDQNEIDIEYATNATADTNNDDLAIAAKGLAPQNSDSATLPVLQYTNQKHTKNSPESRADHFTPGPPGSEHEYRIDWTPGRSDFFIDGELVDTLTVNVPSEGGQWVFNNWANGDPGFSYGPPVNDAVLSIRSIVMYYNTTNSTDTGLPAPTGTDAVVLPSGTTTSASPAASTGAGTKAFPTWISMWQLVAVFGGWIWLS